MSSALQELKATADNVPIQALEDSRLPRRSVCGQKAWNGVAVLSRHPIEEVPVRPAGRRGGRRRALLLRVKTAGPRLHDRLLPERQGHRSPGLSAQAGVVRLAPGLPGRFTRRGRVRGSLRRLQHRTDPPRHPRRGSSGRRHPPHGGGARAGFARCWTSGSSTCSGNSIRRRSSSPGGTTGLAPSIATLAFGSTSCWRQKPSGSGSRRSRPTATTGRRRRGSSPPTTRR